MAKAPEYVWGPALPNNWVTLTLVHPTGKGVVNVTVGEYSFPKTDEVTAFILPVRV